MNLDDFSTEVEGRRYLDPEVSLREQESFINNLRQSQIDANKEIATQTYNLGTAVPSNLGGLTGGEGYWTSRYQTPQTDTTVANLRAAAQAQALNDVLANEQAAWKKRYQDAYRAYQKNIHNRSYGGGGNGGNDTENVSTWSGEPKVVSTDLDESEITDIADTITNQTIPPNPYSDQFNIDGKEQTQRISERSGLPEWLVNVLKIMP